ncbi:LOW QUALITY PROTEIN: uncharacterized protein LOC115757183 [Rhodamnia argentea]|uniref:LOW QUALITY PROTEIN: uncharacterized protein LOC115757183 n=1 Tax=Rhodamnia argentea TaxID=178133 RepID=A0ABM3HX32_9MYRT|nr:LOW QUALITY PROTEIN: uncharacterized protein LOC115757183 [Rhodamnia argentea]
MLNVWGLTFSVTGLILIWELKVLVNSTYRPMASASELVNTLVILVTKPFSLLKQICLFGVKITLIILHTWMELIMAAISLHVNLCWKVILWMVALATLPFRILTSVQRERQLEVNLLAMQLELENLVWERRGLEEHYRKAVKEREVLEFILSELEDEHEKTMARLEVLEEELPRLKTENLQLKEIQGQELWNFRVQAESGNGLNGSRGDHHDVPRGSPPSKFSYNGSSAFSSRAFDAPRFMGRGQEKYRLAAQLTKQHESWLLYSPDMEMSRALAQQREVALKRSLVSSVLSLMVSLTIWEAGDLCMPLVMALFTVVGMSLVSVVQLFSTIRNKPASDAVALLSLNWFMLGTLSYPTLPRVARILVPATVSMLDWTIRWLGASSE